jgi:hypothetical protein
MNSSTTELISLSVVKFVAVTPFDAKINEIRTRSCFLSDFVSIVGGNPNCFLGSGMFINDDINTRHFYFC